MLAVSLALPLAVSGCGKEDAASAPAASPPVAEPSPATPAAPPSADPHADPHGPGGPMAEPPPAVRRAEGTIELTIDGTPQRIGFLPVGRNAAVSVASTGVSRVTIGGAESLAGTPSFSITLSGIKLDEIELPATFATPEAKAKPKAKATIPRITWQVGDRRIYRSSDDGSHGPTKVVLESYAGGRVQGTFSGTLVMGDGKLDPPLSVVGKFDVSLRLNGVAPDRAGT